MALVLVVARDAVKDEVARVGDLVPAGNGCDVSLTAP